MPRFSKSIKELLEKNPNVLEVSSQISYTFKFKKEAVKAYKSGISPKEIFRRADIDLNLFSAKYAKNSVWRWVEIVEKYGVEGLREEHRGKNATGRPPKKKFKSESRNFSPMISASYSHISIPTVEVRSLKAVN